MIHIAAMALLALSLNQTPALAQQGKVKFPPRTAKPRPQPQPAPETPAPAPAEPEPPAPEPSQPSPSLPSQPPIPTPSEQPYVAVIRSHSPQIESCYARVRAWNSSIQGEIVVEWDITPSGNVLKASVTSNSTGSLELASCILQEVRTWLFSASDSNYPTHVSYPFRFQSS